MRVGSLFRIGYKAENQGTFHQPTDMYIENQKIIKVKSFTLFAPDNSIMITDSF